MKTGLLIITGFYLVLTLFVIISHLLRGSQSKRFGEVIKAVTNEDTTSLGALLKRNIDLEMSDKRYHYMKPLMIAAGTGNQETVRMLLDHGADVNAMHFDQTTAIFYAIAGNHTEIVKVMIGQGAATNRSDKSGNTPLILASLIGDESLVKYLMDDQADVNATNAEQAGIEYFNNSYKMQDRSLEGKKNLEQSIRSIKSRSRGVEKIVDIKFSVELITYSRDLDENFWKPPLWYAIDHENPDMFKEFMEHGADIHWTVKNRNGFGNDSGLGMNVLMYASYKGKTDIIKVLMDDGVDLNARDERQRNGLYYAILGKSVKAVRMLFNQGINQVVDESLNRTALELASSLRNEEIVQTLLELGAIEKPPIKKSTDVPEHKPPREL